MNMVGSTKLTFMIDTEDSKSSFCYQEKILKGKKRKGKIKHHRQSGFTIFHLYLTHFLFSSSFYQHSSSSTSKHINSLWRWECLRRDKGRRIHRNGHAEKEKAILCSSDFPSPWCLRSSYTPRPSWAGPSALALRRAAPPAREQTSRPQRLFPSSALCRTPLTSIPLSPRSAPTWPNPLHRAPPRACPSISPTEWSRSCTHRFFAGFLPPQRGNRSWRTRRVVMERLARAGRSRRCMRCLHRRRGRWKRWGVGGRAWNWMFRGGMRGLWRHPARAAALRSIPMESFLVLGSLLHNTKFRDWLKI